MKSKIILLALIAFSFCGCWQRETPIRFVRPVKITSVLPLDYYNKEYVGVVSSGEHTNLAFQVGGLIKNTYVDAGSAVRRGQVLASLDPQDFALQLEADRAQYQTATSILERNKRLASREAISKQDLEIATADYQKAKSAYEYSRNQMSYTQLRAPFNGSIEQKMVENFQKVNAGETVFKLISPEVLEVKFTLPESDANVTLIPAQYSIEFENLRGRFFSAKIKDVVDASVNGAGIPVTLTITDAAFNPDKMNIKAGFACRVKLSLSDRPVMKNMVKIPITALFARQDAPKKMYVWVVDRLKSTVAQREVMPIGLTEGDYAIVSEGLSSGEEVVTAGVYQIVEGQKVKILK